MCTHFHAYALVFMLDLVDGVSSVGIDLTSYSISKFTLQLIQYIQFLALGYMY